MRFQSYKTDSPPHINPPCFQNKRELSSKTVAWLVESLYKPVSFPYTQPRGVCPSAALDSDPPSFLWHSQGVVSCHSLDPKKEAVHVCLLVPQWGGKPQSWNQELHHTGEFKPQKVKPALNCRLQRHLDELSKSTGCRASAAGVMLERLLWGLRPGFQLHLQPWDPWASYLTSLGHNFL